MVRPIFPKATSGRDAIPSATPQELATGILDCLYVGARVINLNLALAHPSTAGERELEEALNQAARRGEYVKTFN